MWTEEKKEATKILHAQGKTISEIAEILNESKIRIRNSVNAISRERKKKEVKKNPCKGCKHLDKADGMCMYLLHTKKRRERAEDGSCMSYERRKNGKNKQWPIVA